uniref:MORN repeat containing 3 n=1 Tax=Poecilia latipinna TaxID=48699 RepID=A0A3B3VJ32_9TELE
MGTYKCPRTGMSYSGQWDHVCFNSYPSGNTYTGEWKNNLRHGEGTMNWTKLGQQYVGSWKDGVTCRDTLVILQQCHILMFITNWIGIYICLIFHNQYRGEFFEGQRHGKGIFYYAGGAIYTGEWRNNKKHGQVSVHLRNIEGILTARSGRVFECEFDDDLILASLSEDRAPPPLGKEIPDLNEHSKYISQFSRFYSRLCRRPSAVRQRLQDTRI